jgi:hypothetical protein
VHPFAPQVGFGRFWSVWKVLEQRLLNSNVGRFASCRVPRKVAAARENGRRLVFGPNFLPQQMHAPLITQRSWSRQCDAGAMGGCSYGTFGLRLAFRTARRAFANNLDPKKRYSVAHKDVSGMELRRWVNGDVLLPLRRLSLTQCHPATCSVASHHLVTGGSRPFADRPCISGPVSKTSGSKRDGVGCCCPARLLIGWLPCRASCWHCRTRCPCPWATSHRVWLRPAI